jgi:hypothetical protein
MLFEFPETSCLLVLRSKFIEGSYDVGRPLVIFPFLFCVFTLVSSGIEDSTTFESLTILLDGSISDATSAAGEVGGRINASYSN